MAGMGWPDKAGLVSRGKELAAALCCAPLSCGCLAACCCAHADTARSTACCRLHVLLSLLLLSLLQAPDVLVNDATLQLLVELRPASLQDLSSVSGFGVAALQHYAQPLLQVRGA